MRNRLEELYKYAYEELMKRLKDIRCDDLDIDNNAGVLPYSRGLVKGLEISVMLAKEVNEKE